MLPFWISRRPHHIVLYSRPGCHLCDDTLRLLQTMSRRYRLTVEVVDITADPDLVRRYDIQIPVLQVDGKIEVIAPVTRRKILDALR